MFCCYRKLYKYLFLFVIIKPKKKIAITLASFVTSAALISYSLYKVGTGFFVDREYFVHNNPVVAEAVATEKSYDEFKKQYDFFHANTAALENTESWPAVQTISDFYQNKIDSLEGRIDSLNAIPEMKALDEKCEQQYKTSVKYRPVLGLSFLGLIASFIGYSFALDSKYKQKSSSAYATSGNNQ